MSTKRISRFLVLSLWIISLLLLMASQVKAATVITVEPALEVDCAQLLLKDVAHIETDNQAFAASLGSLKLGRAPRLGQTKRYRRSLFLTRLKQLRINPDSLTLNIPEQVMITRSSTTIKVSELAQVARTAILDQMAYQNQEVHIRLISVNSELSLPRGEVTFKAELKEQKELTGRQVVPIQVFVDELPVRKVNVSLVVEVYAPVWVTSHNLKRHHLITQNDLEQKRLRINDFQGEKLISNLDDLIGQRTRVAIKQDKPLSAHRLESPPLIERGDLVTLKAYHRNISLLTDGQALESGSLGEVIRVKSKSTDKMLLAKIVSSEIVEVEVK